MHPARPSLSQLLVRAARTDLHDLDRDWQGRGLHERLGGSDSLQPGCGAWCRCYRDALLRHRNGPLAQYLGGRDSPTSVGAKQKADQIVLGDGIRRVVLPNSAAGREQGVKEM